MLEYLTNLSYVALRKTEGMKIENDPAIERLVTNRTVLEKIRPIEQKLKYQIDKAVKVADTGQVSATDPMNFKANPAALVSKLGDGDDDEEEDDGEGADTKEGVRSGKKGGKYVVPKNVPAYYEEERDSREAVMRKKQVHAAREKARFEEEHFMRLPLTKKD